MTPRSPGLKPWALPTLRAAWREVEALTPDHSLVPSEDRALTALRVAAHGRPGVSDAVPAIARAVLARHADSDPARRVMWGALIELMFLLAERSVA